MTENAEDSKESGVADKSQTDSPALSDGWTCPNCGEDWEDESAAIGTANGEQCIGCVWEGYP